MSRRLTNDQAMGGALGLSGDRHGNADLGGPAALCHDVSGPHDPCAPSCSSGITVQGNAAFAGTFTTATSAADCSLQAVETSVVKALNADPDRSSSDVSKGISAWVETTNSSSSETSLGRARKLIDGNLIARHLHCPGRNVICLQPRVAHGFISTARNRTAYGSLRDRYENRNHIELVARHSGLQEM